MPERSTIQDNVGNENENTTSSLQESSDAVHSQTSTADANLPDNIGDSLIDVGSALADEFLHSTQTSKAHTKTDSFLRSVCRYACKTILRR